MLDAVNTAVRIALDLVLPKADDKPPVVSESPKVSTIPAAVSLDLLLPICSKLVLPRGEAPTVPVVAVDKYCNSASHKYKIRTSGEPSAMLPKT
jgi:hypothetical protein